MSIIINPPPKVFDLFAGFSLNAGLSKSTVLPDIDFETYSPAGSTWNIGRHTYTPLPGATFKGIKAVGAAVYAEHPEAEIISCAYNLKNGLGAKLWVPGDPPPVDLFNHVVSGGLLEAWNSIFEYYVWNKIAVRLHGWPPLPLEQLRCASAKSRAFALPKSLADASAVMKILHAKDPEGKRLINKFCVPRAPTHKNPNHRIYLKDDPVDAYKFYMYNVRDIEAEAELSSLTPDLNPFELEFWLCDQRINVRGVAVDTESIKNCIAILEQAQREYNQELSQLTEGVITSASQVQKMVNWLALQGIHTISLAEEPLTELLKRIDLTPKVRRVLEIRSFMGSAAVKKLYAMLNRSTIEGRLHDLFIYHSARTGRAAGAGVQPQNFPNSGNMVALCNNQQCARYYSRYLEVCPWCGSLGMAHVKEWNAVAVEHALEIIKSRNLKCVEYYYGDAVSTISGCLRGMFIASPKHDLLCSDYSAIEAVVLAALAGEQWRLDVFRTHGKIYEMSAAMISGIPFDTIIDHKAMTGQHHPLRKLGKVSELSSGYQGFLGAWKAFGADDFLSEEEIKQAILKWREASPRIVAMWGGQPRLRTEIWTGEAYINLGEYYGLEGAAIQAIMQPGSEFDFRGITYFCKAGILYCRLLSGRYLTYHNVFLEWDNNRGVYKITFEGWNSNPKYGAIGWIRMSTYGGKLTENVVQATARDILAEAIVNLEKAGYPTVLHVHDEIVVEVKEGFGSVEEMERIMSRPPVWAAGWPIRASGGWRAKRYGK